MLSTHILQRLLGRMPPGILAGSSDRTKELSFRAAAINPMTHRLYYRDSFLYEFDANVVDIVPANDSSRRSAVMLDETAFYPTSGGQIFDTGWMSAGGEKFRVSEVVDGEDGRILHYVDGRP